MEEKPFNPWTPVTDRACPSCMSTDRVFYRLVESSDGAHEDDKYKCDNCGKVWWVDGPDY